jgi:hypothetical protein
MTEPPPTTLIVETTDDNDCPIEFLGDSADIVYFISFAHSDRYGAVHPLARAGGLLKRKYGVNMAPLLTFADARVENQDEERALETMWQDGTILSQSARAAAEAIEKAPELRDLTAGLSELPDRLRELADMAAWAADRGARVRLTYVI